jgi:hypothetical protein
MRRTRKRLWKQDPSTKMAVLHPGGRLAGNRVWTRTSSSGSATPEEEITAKS